MHVRVGHGESPLGIKSLEPKIEHAVWWCNTKQYCYIVSYFFRGNNGEEK